MTATTYASNDAWFNRTVKPVPPAEDTIVTFNSEATLTAALATAGANVGTITRVRQTATFNTVGDLSFKTLHSPGATIILDGVVELVAARLERRVPAIGHRTVRV